MASSTPKERLVRLVRPGILPPGVTGKPWPRRLGHRGFAYRGKTYSFRWIGLFVGRLDESEQCERWHMESV